MHYLAVFCVGPGIPDSKILLGFSPFEQRGDLSAAQHVNYLLSVLEEYNLKIDSVGYLVGDNCNVNRKTADDLGIPLIGCHSHRLNLAVAEYPGLSHDDGDK